MDSILSRAFEKVKLLSEKDQEAIGVLVLEELADETKWQQSFADNNKLKKLADSAREEIARGDVSGNDWSENPFSDK